MSSRRRPRCQSSDGARAGQPLSAWRAKHLGLGGGVALIVLTLVSTGATGCKPASEPRRPNQLAPPGFLLDASSEGTDLNAWLHGPRVSVSSSHEPLIRPGADAQVGTESAQAEDRAREELGRGEQLLGQGRVEEAILAVQKAIDAKPDWPKAHFLLAIAHANADLPERVLSDLDHLVSLADPKADRFLREARVRPEFNSLHSQTRFRQATRFVPVEVAPARGLTNRSLLRELVQGLRERLIPAHVGKTWRGKEIATTVYYARKEVLAEEAALEVVRVAALPPRVTASKYLNAKRPVVLVLVEADTASAGAFLTHKRLDDFMGKTLKATRDTPRQSDQLVLEKTGFFRWNTDLPTGRRQERTGRYHVASNRLSLSFRWILKDAHGTVMQTRQGRRSAHRLQLREDGFVLDDLQFRMLKTAPAKKVESSP